MVKNDKDCKLGVHTASNQHNERNFEFYWGYKNHVPVDCITGLPIYELTTAADVADCSVVLDVLSQTNIFLSIKECTFIADKLCQLQFSFIESVCSVFHAIFPPYLLWLFLAFTRFVIQTR